MSYVASVHRPTDESKRSGVSDMAGWKRKICNAAARYIESVGGQATLRQMFENMTYLDGRLVRLSKGSPTNPQALGQYLRHDKLRRFKNNGGPRHHTKWVLVEGE